MLCGGRSLVLGGVMALVSAPLFAREACQERTLSLRFAPQPPSAQYWCWAASGQMVMEWLGEEPDQACACRQAEQVLGASSCCAAASACTPAASLPSACDRPRWPAFVESPDRYRFFFQTTCDDLTNRQDDADCVGRPLGFDALTAEICAGRPVLAAFRSPGAAIGHLVVVKGISTHGRRRVLVVDPKRLCPEGRDCEGELDEAFWVTYDEWALGLDGRAHWVDFYDLRRATTPPAPERTPKLR